MTNRNRVSKPFLKLWGELFVSMNRDSAVVFQLSFHSNSTKSTVTTTTVTMMMVISDADMHSQLGADQSQKPSTTLSDKEKEMMKRCL